MTSPMNSSGVTTSTLKIGSRSTGLARRAASLKASDPATLKAISDESVSWYLPSVSVTRTSTSGKPMRGPLSIASSTPFSTAGMNSVGTEPPRILLMKSKPSPGAGSTSM